MIDLRSDTVTRPTPGMLEAMMNARVGDDVFHEDPTVKELEAMAAERFGMEAGLFCPSGTMTNQIAVRILTDPQDEVICDKRSHVYNYEGGGLMANSLVSVRLVDGDRGRISPGQVLENINPDDIHFPRTRLLSLENTVNKGGGSIYSLDQIQELSETARSQGLAVHLDGARVFNALVESQDDSKRYGECFDTISICLSKGLGAPIGSLILTSAALIRKALRVRKVFGGGMRQVGYLAAAGIYALENHVERLKEDHQRARAIGKVLETLDYVETVEPVDTNIVIFRLEEGLTTSGFLSTLSEAGVEAVPFGPRDIRLVTHLDFDDGQLNQLLEILQNLNISV